MIVSICLNFASLSIWSRKRLCVCVWGGGIYSALPDMLQSCSKKVISMVLYSVLRDRDHRGHLHIPQTFKFYGLPKIHKPDVPLRPSVAS